MAGLYKLCKKTCDGCHGSQDRRRVQAAAQPPYRRSSLVVEPSRPRHTPQYGAWTALMFGVPASKLDRLFPL